jgi:hypothetical protein
VALSYDSDDIFDFDDNEINGFGFRSGEPGGGLVTLLNDSCQCEECAGKMERDLLLQRDWD